MKYISIIFLTISITLIGHAQNITDAVRWSLHNPGGTARTFGVGSSFGAMGGDFSVININPAGLGEYARGEFMFTPSINLNSSTSYLKQDADVKSEEDKSTFKIDNIGLVINSNPIGSDWTHSNFAIGFNKIANLNKSFYFEGNTVGSITKEFEEYANGRTVDELDDFRAYPAYRVGAIYDFDEDNFYDTDFDEFDYKEVQKSQLVDQEGYINELTFAWGGKYLNKFNMGLSVGVPFVSFEETKVYTETDPGDEFPVFDELQFVEYLNTSGVGVNFRAGFIYEITKMIRLGGAVHSPTWYTLTDDYYTNIEYAYTDTESNRFEHRSPDGSFRYRINSPWKVVGSLGTIYKISDDIMGFVNADVEWLDYGESSVDLSEYSSDPAEAQKTIQVNREISQFLGSALNVRVGTELGIKKFRVRTGFETAQSPFNSQTERNNALSFGVGIRENNFFIDMGIRFNNFSEGYLPYTVLDSERDPLVNIDNKTTRFLMTVGFKF